MVVRLRSVNAAGSRLVLRFAVASQPIQLAPHLRPLWVVWRGTAVPRSPWPPALARSRASPASERPVDDAPRDSARAESHALAYECPTCLTHRLLRGGTRARPSATGSPPRPAHRGILDRHRPRERDIRGSATRPWRNSGGSPSGMRDSLSRPPSASPARLKRCDLRARRPSSLSCVMAAAMPAMASASLADAAPMLVEHRQ